jgi:hypothetical protein
MIATNLHAVCSGLASSLCKMGFVNPFHVFDCASKIASFSKNMKQMPFRSQVPDIQAFSASFILF